MGYSEKPSGGAIATIGFTESPYGGLVGDPLGGGSCRMNANFFDAYEYRGLFYLICS